MKIIIVGCGKVGYAIAQQLTQEKHDITVVDDEAAHLNRADSTLDVLCIHGNGASISVLMEAGARDADLVIAVTGVDETNLVCAKTVQLHHIRVAQRIACVRRIGRAVCSTVVRAVLFAASRQRKDHHQRQRRPKCFPHRIPPCYRLSLSQMQTVPVSLVRFISMTRWFRLPRNCSEISFSSFINRPSTSTSMHASISSVASHRG